MSERAELSQRIADFIALNRLTTPYGGEVFKTPQKKHYSILFSCPRTLDGVVNVYGPKFIQVTYQTGYRDLPSRDNRVFESAAAAIEFLDKAFVKGDYQGALQVPVKAK